MKIGNADADEAEELGRSFEFRLCDQSDYIDKLN